MEAGKSLTQVYQDAGVPKPRYPLNDWNKENISIFLPRLKVPGVVGLNVTIDIYSTTFWANTQYKVDECVKAIINFVKNEQKFRDMFLKELQTSDEIRIYVSDDYHNDSRPKNGKVSGTDPNGDHWTASMTMNANTQNRIHIYAIKSTNPDYLLSSTDLAVRKLLKLPYNPVGQKGWQPFEAQLNAIKADIEKEREKLTVAVGGWPEQMVAPFVKPKESWKYYDYSDAKNNIKPAGQGSQKKSNNNSVKQASNGQSSGASKQVNNKAKASEQPSKQESASEDEEESEELADEEYEEEAAKVDSKDDTPKNPLPPKLNAKEAAKIDAATNEMMAAAEGWRGYLKNMCTLV